MSRERSSKSEKPTLTREELLEALDKDIEHISADQSAAGINNWAILGAIAALLWFALDAWEQGRFVFSNVLILTLALTITWDWLKQMVEQLDSSLLADSQKENRFLSLTGWLGSSRTSIIFDLAKEAVFLGVTLHLKSPSLLWPQIYFSLRIIGIVWTLVVSYLDFLPEISRNSKFLPYSALRAGIVINAIMSASVGLFAWGTIWIEASEFTTHDWRMGLVFSALIYLVSLAVQSRIPAHLLKAYTTTRCNLAYGRISLEDAKNQADLLSIGGTLDQTLSLHLKRAMNATERVSSSFKQTRQKVMIFSESITTWIDLPESPERTEKQLKSEEHWREILSELKEGEVLLRQSQKSWNNFEARFRHLALSSSDSLTTVETLFKQARDKSNELVKSFIQTNELSNLANEVIKVRKDNNALKENLAKLRKAQGDLENN